MIDTEMRWAMKPFHNSMNLLLIALLLGCPQWCQVAACCAGEDRDDAVACEVFACECCCNPASDNDCSGDRSGDRPVSPAERCPHHSSGECICSGALIQKPDDDLAGSRVRPLESMFGCPAMSHTVELYPDVSIKSQRHDGQPTSGRTLCCLYAILLC